MLLTPELAQPIVQRATMATIQRNINIMDANGVIVGSGDPSRIGNLHQAAAAEAVRKGCRIYFFVRNSREGGHCANRSCP